MSRVGDICQTLDQIAPLETAESWDNVGLLLGDENRSITKVMTCLTLTSAVLEEAVQSGTKMVVTHHPIPFKPLQKLTAATTTGRILLRAAEEGIAIYSPHTAWDNASQGINQQLAEALGLENVRPLKPFLNAKQPNTGMGRQGLFSAPIALSKVEERLRQTLPSMSFRHTRESTTELRSIGIVCGSGGGFVSLVAQQGCDAMLTGESTYHQCLEAESLGICLIQIGHHASESFSMKTLAAMIEGSHSDIEAFASLRDVSEF
jgi:dinuclear metal center YbgI/SA1388 family protein